MSGRPRTPGLLTRFSHVRHCEAAAFGMSKSRGGVPDYAGVAGYNGSFGPMFTLRGSAMRLQVLSVVFVLALLCAVVRSATAADRIGDSVVKVYATRRAPDFVAPVEQRGVRTRVPARAWSSTESGSSPTPTSCCTPTRFSCRGASRTDRIPAKATAVAPGMDLAILEVERRSFFDDHPPLAVADNIPAIKQTVNVYGFPIGGEQMSVTQGIVSRIEYTNINLPGRGSADPDRRRVEPRQQRRTRRERRENRGPGLQQEQRGENIGYLIAAEEIRMFLHDLRDGVYHGKPQLWDYLGPTQNEALRPSSGWRSSRARWFTRRTARCRIIRSRNGTSSRASATIPWTARAR